MARQTSKPNGRKPIPKSVETELLTSCKRRCCLCFALNQDLRTKQGQIAHLDNNPSHNDIDNLVWLCLDHHDQYDSRTSQSKGFTLDEVRLYKNQLVSTLAAIEQQAIENYIVDLPRLQKQTDELSH